MYYLSINGQRTGPYRAEDIQRMLRQNAIGYETQFWKDGMFAWETIGSQRHLFETPVFQQMPPQQPMYQQTPVYKVLSEEGPDHSKLFKMAVLIFDKEIGVGHGASKKESQQSAAEDALMRYQVIESEGT